MGTLVCYWGPQGLVLENFQSRKQTPATPFVVEVLGFFETWHTVADLRARLDGVEEALLLKAVLALWRGSLLERSDDRSAIDPAREWISWSPAATFLHFGTKDVAYVRDVEAGEALLRRQARRHPMPSPVKRYARAPLRALPPAQDGPLADVLLRRRTWRRFSRRPVSEADLATLLGLTFGIQGWMPLGELGRVPLKTSPSGGARHSIEAYVLARRVSGLAPGLYHYAPDRHGLERLKRGATPAQIERYLPTQWWYRGASAVVFMTSVFPRVMWRYDYPRAYRAVLIEAGHLCQTFLLVATSLGLAPFCSMALADSRIERDLGVDGVTESVLYAAGVGTRPPGVESAQAPARRRHR